MKAIKTLLAVSALATVAGAANATVWDVTMSANNVFAALQGNLVMNFTGTWDDSTNQGTWTGNSHAENSPLSLDLTYTQTFTMNKTTGAGKLNALNQATCTDTSSGSACAGFGPALAGNYFNNTGNTTAAYKSKQAFTPTDGGVYQWTFQFNTSGTDASGNPILVYIPVPTQVTLHAQATPTVPVPAAAWLFGSGLLGLAGTARRRRSV